MNFKSILPEAISNALFEEEVKPKSPQTPSPILPNLTTSSFAQAYASPEGVSTSVAIEAGAVDPALYSSLVKKTDFDQTEVGAKVKSLLEPLSSLPVTDAQKLDIVFKLGAKDNVSLSSIQEALNTCLGKLDTEQNKFNQIVDRTQVEIDNIQKDIAADNDKIKDLESKIEEVRKHQTDTTASMFQKKNSLDQNKALFQAAYDRRKQDLQKQQNHYNNLTTT